MAVTANQLITRQDGDRRSYPVEESTTLYQGTAAFLNAAGYAVGATASGVNGFIGIVVGYIANSGADGAKQVEVLATGDFVLPVTGLAQADVGSTIYATDNYTFTTTAGTDGVAVGKIVRFLTSTSVVVSIKTIGTGTAQVAPLTTITIADAEGTPDYAWASFTNSTAWGFASEQEMITAAYVIKNLQERVLALEARVP